jgi:hypothetical protein
MYRSVAQKTSSWQHYQSIANTIPFRGMGGSAMLASCQLTSQTYLSKPVLLHFQCFWSKCRVNVNDLLWSKWACEPCPILTSFNKREHDQTEQIMSRFRRFWAGRYLVYRSFIVLLRRISHSLEFYIVSAYTCGPCLKYLLCTLQWNRNNYQYAVTYCSYILGNNIQIQ